MTKTYTTKDLVRQTISEMSDSGLANISRKALMHFAEGTGFLYATPTINRRFTERRAWQNPAELRPKEACGLVTAFAPAVLYGDLKYLGIPVATSLASWVYEKVRSAKRKLEDEWRQENDKNYR